MLRLGAVAIVLLPLALGAVLRDLAWGPWLGAGLAILLGIAITVARPRSRSLALLGTMLAVFAGLAAPQLHMLRGPPTIVDLRSDSLPPDLRGPAEVTGFFRDQWQLAEYAVPEGALPQQDEVATAQLVPFVGIEEGPIPLRGAILIVRVPPGDEKASGVKTLHGHAQALEPELLGTFVHASGLQVPEGVIGLVLDTITPPATQSPWLRGGLVSLAVLAAFMCLWIATRPVAPAAPEPVESR